MPYFLQVYLLNFAFQKPNMAIILNIETATKNCSVALAKEGKRLHAKRIAKFFPMPKNYTFFIEELLAENNFTIF